MSSTEFPPVSVDEPLYPYLVVRFCAAFYGRRPMKFYKGGPRITIARGSCIVQTPISPFVHGELTSGIRWQLISAVQKAVRERKLRMCLVWSKTSCTYVEAGRILHSADPPSGGVDPPIDIGFSEALPEPETAP